MGRSSASAPEAVLRRRRPDGTPIYGYAEEPGRPPLRLVRMHDEGEPRPAVHPHRHAHDFHVLVYVERGAGRVRVGDEYVEMRAGRAHALPPGQVIGADGIPDVVERAWTVAFSPEAVPALTQVSPLGWEHHPLLALFADGGTGVTVPPPDRQRWLGWLGELDAELRAPARLGADEAAAALLTQLLVAAARLAPGTPVSLDPLVERVFAVIEAGYATPISASDVARSLGYTPGHLTTVLRERTGRTLLEWIVERRLTEARRLLRDTDLPLGVIAARTGLGDAGYLVRRFRRRYGVTPERWRRGQRTATV